MMDKTCPHPRPDNQFSHVYAKANKHLALKAATDFTVMLLTHQYSYHPDHNIEDVIPFQVAGRGYWLGGLPLEDWEVDELKDGSLRLTAKDTAWGPMASFSARSAVVVAQYGGELVMPITFHDFVNDCPIYGGTFTVVWNKIGITTLCPCLA